MGQFVLIAGRLVTPVTAERVTSRDKSGLMRTGEMKPKCGGSRTEFQLRGAGCLGGYGRCTRAWDSRHRRHQAFGVLVLRARHNLSRWPTLHDLSFVEDG